MSFQKHDFFDFMNSVKANMAAEYDRIRRRSTDDPGTAGDEAEENWADLLRSWLPANYPVVTKGRILNTKGIASPQVDILVLSPNYPLALRDKKHYFAGGVLAAFECKLTLRRADIKKAFSNAVFIKSLWPARKGNPYDELHQPIVYGLLAHSHEWKGPKKTPPLSLIESISAAQASSCQHPREMLDLICIADTAVFSLVMTICAPPKSRKEVIKDFREMGLKSGISTSYLFQDENQDHPYDPRGDILGGLIFEITKRLAFEHEELRSFADYLWNIGIWGGIGQMHLWSLECLSTSVRKKLRTSGFRTQPWSKWAEDY